MMTGFYHFRFFSDGAGRSGVYLAIDANIELSEEDGVFDVYGYLVKMRQQRRGLVETLVSAKSSLKVRSLKILLSKLHRAAVKMITSAPCNTKFPRFLLLL